MVRREVYEEPPGDLPPPSEREESRENLPVGRVVAGGERALPTEVLEEAAAALLAEEALLLVVVAREVGRTLAVGEEEGLLSPNLEARAATLDVLLSLPYREL